MADNQQPDAEVLAGARNILSEMAADDYPEFRELLKRLEVERAGIMAASASLRSERDQVVAQIQPLEARHRELTQQIRAIELPRVPALDNKIAGLHRAMGARSLQEGARPHELEAAP